VEIDTPATNYVAPEVWTETSYVEKVDIYLLGVLVYETLVGPTRAPSPFRRLSRFELMGELHKDGRPPNRRLRSLILCLLLSRVLFHDVGLGYQSLAHHLMTFSRSGGRGFSAV
jgi:serine/threonine protein kinase